MMIAIAAMDTITAAPNSSQIAMISRRDRSSLCDAQFSMALNTLVTLYPPLVSFCPDGPL